MQGTSFTKDDVVAVALDIPNCTVPFISNGFTGFFYYSGQHIEKAFWEKG